MAKHYVKLLYPGILFTEYQIKEIPDRSFDPNNAPKNTYGYYIYDVVEVKNRKPYVRRCSSTTYFGKPYTLEEIKKLFPNLKTLIFNIEQYECEGAVLCRTGNWQPLKKGDKVIYEA